MKITAACKAVSEVPSTKRRQMPAGYEWAEDDDAFVPLICQRCGAATVHSGVELHDAWHESVVDDARLAEIVKRKSYR